MANIKWTDEQLKAIDMTGQNILVAAAAGSGKTAVLVERIIRMICRKDSPVSIDKLLILTYTTAAADEMKRKIAAAINDKLAEDPENSALKEQSIKIHSACISTIHAFCSRVIANNAHLTDLPTDYTLISDNAENDILISRALDQVLEAYYERIDKKPAFKELVMSSGTKDDKDLRNIIIELYKFTQSMPYPTRWFYHVKSSLYKNISSKEGLYNSGWYEPIKSAVYKYAKTAADAFCTLNQIINEANVPKDNPHYIYYFNLMHEFCDVFNTLDPNNSNDFERLCKLINDFAFPRVSTKQDHISDIKPTLNFYRKEVAASALNRAKILISTFSADNVDRLSKSAPTVCTLCNITRLLEKTHTRLKREKSAIDFGDLEHYLLKLICGHNGKETPLCQSLRQNYHEILIDEFQDTNPLQFEIFTRLSNKNGNLFMVGDVKQSIYKFRHADPSIFLSLYNNYAKGDGGYLIKLFRNFRSRNEVISSVNQVFKTVMSVNTGGIDYTTNEYLIPGASYPMPQCDSDLNCDFTTEIMINNTPTDTEDPKTHKIPDIQSTEAQHVANRIVNLVTQEKLCVTDKETGLLRPARFGDVAVLSPGWDVCTKVEEALLSVGVSCFCEKSSHYLDSVEVATVLAFLQVIDNPLQDIPLIAVLRSPIFKFNANELAKIRTLDKNNYFFALKAAAAAYNDDKSIIDKKTAALQDKNNTDKSIDILTDISAKEKASYFMSVLEDLRQCSKYMGTDELVHKICYDLDYISIVASMPKGEIRKANLTLLLQRCSEFEQGTMTGLFNFIQYIERLKSTGDDLRPAVDAMDFQNTVTVMSIHKSKGLEFPIVILCGIDKRFNIQDTYGRFIWSSRIGISGDYVDTAKRIRYEMPQKALIADKIRNEMYAERLRLLYVAMTRAKEKLIISASLTKVGSAWKNVVFTQDKKMHPSAVLSASNMRDWIWGSVMATPDGKPLREISGRLDIVPDCQIPINYTIKIFENNPFDTEISSLPKKIEDSLMTDGSSALLQDRIDYVYPHIKSTSLPIKMSVSDLKRRIMPGDDYTVNLIKPSSGLIRKTEDFTAAEIGTVTHYVLQHITIKKDNSPLDISNQIDCMVKDEIISKEQLAAVNKDAIIGFFASPLGKRLSAAENFWREYDFYMLVSAKDAYPDTDESSQIMVQGIADCLFLNEEKNGIVLIDYKTDRVSENGARERSLVYTVQMDYYAKGLEEILNLPVTEKHVYFLNCGADILMP